MSRYETRQEVAEKIDYEGGIYDMLFGYGLAVDDLPEHDMLLKVALQAVIDLVDEFADRVDAFMLLLPDATGEYDG